MSISVTDKITGNVFVVTATATVRDAPLSASADNISAVPGVAFTGTVASFSDVNSSAPLSDYTASISWGDGTTTQGKVSNASSGPDRLGLPHL